MVIPPLASLPQHPCCAFTPPQVLESKGKGNLPTALEALTEVTVKYPFG